MFLKISYLTFFRKIHTSNFVVAKATAKDREEVLRVMENTFYKSDPSSIYSKVSENLSISSAFQKMTVESLAENLSFAAKEKEEDRKIFGVAINGIRPVILNPMDVNSLMNELESESEKTLLELWNFVSTMPPNADKYFEGARNVFEIKYLAVEPSHRNKGVATTLVNVSKKEAAARGHKFIRIDCTSHFTARIASAAGMHCIYKINYQDYKNSSGQHVFHNVIFPHTKIHVYAGQCS